jgi:hypothetical protein
VQGWFTICKNHKIFKTDAGKAFDGIQHTFMIRVLKKLARERKCYNIVKTIYSIPMFNNILNGEQLKAFPLKSAMNKGYPLSLLFFNMC